VTAVPSISSGVAKCETGCKCGKHRLRPCPEGCSCKRHSASRHRKKPRVTLQCLHCDTPFEVIYWREKSSKYCSTRCQVGARRTIAMSPDEFDARYAAQGEACAICKQHISGSDVYRDHDHRTQKWRGLLCRNCNFAIGLMADDPERLVSAAFYLTKEVDVLDNLTSQQ
jgi:hypothetical protein